MAGPDLLEFSVVGLVLLLVAAPLAWRLMRRRSLPLRLGTLAVWMGAYVSVSAAYYALIEEPVPESEAVGRPLREPSAGYVGSETCRSCHPGEHATWFHSYHRTMTQVASAESVVGDFENTVLTMEGVNYARDYTLTESGGEHWVEVGPVRRPESGDDGEGESSTKHRVVMTTGSHHMQVYWYDGGHGRSPLLLPFVYLIDGERWIPRYAAFLRAPDLPVDEPPGRWNKTCIKCHTTRGIPGFDPSREEDPHTRVAEFGISCEACHGPGEEHVRLNRNPGRRYRLHFAEGGDETIAQPERMKKALDSQVCGQCHSNYLDRSLAHVRKWRADGHDFRPGGNLEEKRLVIRRHQDRPKEIEDYINSDPLYLDGYFWKDGMIRVSGREYNGLTESPCHERGELSCMSCHTMHPSPGDGMSLKDWKDDQLGPGMRTNRACTQCHSEYEEEDRLVAHTRHAPTSSGSACYNCHMPHTTYGLLKGIRSHTIDSPSVATTLETGRPNACNLCHLDKSLAWTSEHMAEFYGHGRTVLPEEHRSIAASLVWMLKGDAAQRALLAWHMSWPDAREVAGDGWMAPHLATLFADPYPVVRVIAQRSMKGLPGVKEELRAEFDLTWLYDKRVEHFRAITGAWSGWALQQDGDWPRTLLIRPNRTLDTGRIRPLLLQRDDKRMLLNE